MFMDLRCKLYLTTPAVISIVFVVLMAAVCVCVCVHVRVHNFIALVHVPSSL